MKTTPIKIQAQTVLNQLINDYSSTLPENERIFRKNQFPLTHIIYSKEIIIVQLQ